MNPKVPTPSDEQKAAIEYRRGHLQITACAGSGKTEAISRRVCSLIYEGIEPCQIVAFTFTERAAKSLQSRIKRHVAEAKGLEFLDRLGPMFVGTIHSYCLQMLQSQVPRFGNYDVLDENRLAGLLSREHKRLGLDRIGERHWQAVFGFLRNVEVVENQLIDHRKLRGTAFGDVFKRFLEMLERYRLLTFGLLISTAVRALEGDSKVHRRVHGALRHVIVDEYQDINPAQERLIELLAQPAVHLCVVGDDDQSIYQWRGSDVSNILNFKKRYKAKLASLSVNRRSRPKIIRAANDFAKSIAPRLKKVMRRHRPNGGPELFCWAADTALKEASVIADTIDQLRKRGYRYRDIAVLYRSARTSSPPLIEVFRERGIPFRCAGRTGLFLQPDAAVMGKLYAWLSDNGWRNEGRGESDVVMQGDLVAEFQRIFNAGGSIRGLKELLRSWHDSVDDDRTSVSLVRDYYKLLNALGVQRLDLSGPVASARMGSLARFSQILADFEHVTRRARWVEEDGASAYRGGQDRGRWFYRRLYNYLQYYSVGAYEDFEGEDTFDLDTVDILTIHQAKGLEWPVVFMPSLVAGRFPSSYSGRPQEWLVPERVFSRAARRRYEGSETDERRLFYVAMTRARDMLYLSRFRRIKNRKAPSPFLLDIAGDDPEDYTRLPLPPPFVPPTGVVDEPPTLTFSGLAQYEDCPMRYRLSDSFGFQPLIAAELGYGKTIHHVLRRIADLARENGALPTAERVQRLFQDEFYLPFANAAAFGKLSARAKALIDRYLDEYSDDLLRVWETERPFSLHLATGVVNGRADVILDHEGGVLGSLALVDYKTATDGRHDDVFAFQLAIYSAAGRGEGLNVHAAYLHRLREGDRTPVPVSDHETQAAQQRATKLIDALVAADFRARPEKRKCRQCDVRAICADAACGKRDF